MMYQTTERPRGNRLPAGTAVLNLILLFFLLWVLVPTAHGQLADPTDQRLDAQASKQYKAAKDYYYQLERNPDGGKREAWLDGVRRFRRIYLVQTEGILAPSCLYMMGRMHSRMYQLFKVPLDLDESIGYYNDVAVVFSRDKLADDALFNIGELLLTQKGEPKRASAFYLKIAQDYPDGDKYAQALDRLQNLAEQHDIPLPDKLTRNKTLNHLVNVLPVNYWSSDDYTRIVIRATAPVHYSSSLLEKNGNQPRRLYIDFAQSFIPPKFRQPIPIQDGLLKQVRTGQFDDNTVRVVLDIESIANYKIFSLNDPFRVVIDVHGDKGGKNPAPAQQTSMAQVSAEVGKKVEPAPADSTSAPFILLRDEKKKRPDTVAKAPASSSPGQDEYSLAQQLGLGVKKIIIDPGHGGKDPGATAFGVQEKEVVLNISKKVARVLHDTYHFQVSMTRSTDTFLPLEERTAIANTQKADLFLSIHVNAHPQKNVGGVETFYLNLATNTEAMRVAALENSTSTHSISEMQDILSDLVKNSKITESSRLAEYVQNSMVAGLNEKNFQLKDLGVKQAPFYVLIGAEMPAILAEIGFVTNPEEAKLLLSDAFTNTIARQIAAGVAEYVERHSAALR